MSATERPIQDSLRDAAKNPGGWDVPGLLEDAANKIDELTAIIDEIDRLDDLRRAEEFGVGGVLPVR